MIRRAAPLLLAVLLGAIVLGARWEVVHRYGSDIPMWDQWDAEARQMLEPLSDGRWHWTDLFLPHNEHRVALTRALSLLEVQLNGQWDARLQCVVNAFLHAVFAAWLFLLARRALGAAWSPAIFVFLAALTALPISWQNVVSGFHSQQFFLLLLSLGCFALLPFSRPGSTPWWMGAVCTFLVLFSMASGLLAPAVVGVLVLLRCIVEGLRPREFVATFAVCAIAIVAGVLLLVRFDPHANLKAQSLAEFLLYARRSLQWPIGHWSGVLLAWSPFVLLFVVLLRRGGARENGSSTFPWLLLALGGWTIAQVLASAYARGAGANEPAARYLDTLLAGTIANGLALAWLARHHLGRARLGVALLAVIWMGSVGYGVYRVARASFEQDLPALRVYLARCESSVRTYLRTKDASMLHDDDVPYPSADALHYHLDRKDIQEWLPASVRLPIAFETMRGDAVAFKRLDSAAAEAGGATSIWTSRERPPGQWQSVALNFGSATTLRMRLTGHSAGGDTPLIAWIEPQWGRTLVDLTPRLDNSGRWREIEFSLPAGPAYLLVRTTSRETWVSFAEPIAVARLSTWAAAACAAGRPLWLAAGPLAMLVLLMDFASRSRREDAPARE